MKSATIVYFMKAIILTFDRLALRFLGGYGNAWIETPNFDRLAADSVVFDQHFGENFDSAAKNHAWWTGCYQFPRSLEQQRSQISLVEMQRPIAVRTWLLTENESEESTCGCPSFDDVEAVTNSRGPDALEEDLPFARLVARAVEVMDELRTAETPSWLLWLKSSGVPLPEDVPTEFASLYLDQWEDEIESLSSNSEFELSADTADTKTTRATRAGCMTWLDVWLGKLLDAIEGCFADDELLLIVTSAAGEAGGRRKDEGGRMKADSGVGELKSAGIDGTSCLCDMEIHTPLIVRVTGHDQMGSRRQGLVQTVDLVPTLCEWFGIVPSHQSCEGRSLWPMIRGEAEQVRDYLCLGDDDRSSAIRTRDFFCVRPFKNSNREGVDCESAASEPQLYLKPEDIWDVHNVANQYPEQVQALSGVLEQFAVQARQSTPMVPTVLPEI